MSIQDRYPSKYRDLIDAETWAFIERTEEWYPAEAIDWSIGKTRETYNAMCREFFAGYPDGVVADDAVIPLDGQEIRVRQYRMDHHGFGQDDETPLAFLLYFHGGGFVVGGLDSHDDVCAELCAGTGFAVMSVDYPLAPEHCFPDDFNAALASFEFLAGVGANLDMPVVLAGDSAGANLCAAVSHATRGGDLRPAGQVLIYPGLGSNMDEGSFVEHAEAPMLATKDTKFYKSMRSGGDETLLERANCSPLNDADFANLPKTFVVSAQCDPLCDDGKNYAERISQAGGKATFVCETGLVHGYLRARHSVRRAKESFERIVAAVSGMI